MNVLEVTPHPKNAEWRVVKTDRGDYIVFAGKLADALEQGKPLPQGTSEEPPKFEGGLPSLRLPRPGGGGPTAYRNTKEAFDAEAASRLAWQQVEEERKDRRTALMTAADRLKTANADVVLIYADSFYEWLRSSPAVSEPAAERGVASKGEVRAQPADTPGVGAETVSGKPIPASPAGGTSSAPQGRDGADTEPGEGHATPSPGFPIDPAKCDHHLRSGNWVKWTSTDQCPKCGTSKLVAMESTTADLGPA